MELCLCLELALGPRVTVTKIGSLRLAAFSVPPPFVFLSVFQTFLATSYVRQ